MNKKSNNIQSWLFAVAFIAFLAIGFGVSELIQPKLITKTDPQTVVTKSNPSNVSSPEPAPTLRDSVPGVSDPEPVVTNPTNDPATLEPKTATAEPKTPTAEPKTPTAEPKKTETPMTTTAEPKTETPKTATAEPKTTTPVQKPAETGATPTQKPATAEAKPTNTVTTAQKPAAAETKPSQPAANSITKEDAQGIVASGIASSKIPDNTTITVNGQKMDYQAFRTGVKQKAYSNIKVTSVNPDGSIVVKATSNYED